MLVLIFQALLLLNQLTKGHASIQKIVAFENAFERIIDILREEGGSDGGKLFDDLSAIHFCVIHFLQAKL